MRKFRKCRNILRRNAEKGVSLRKGGQMRKLRKRIRDFLREEDGISTVEIILIIVVLIGLVIIFKSQLTSLVSSILSKITSKSQGI